MNETEHILGIGYSLWGKKFVLQSTYHYLWKYVLPVCSSPQMKTKLPGYRLTNIKNVKARPQVVKVLVCVAFFML